VVEQVLAFGPFELHPLQRLLLEAGKPVRLGSRALDILIALVQRAGEVVGKDELIARGWPGTTVEEGNLRVHVAALRKALGDGHAGNRFVANIPGRGYSFVAPVESRQESLPPPSHAAPRPARAHADTLPAPLTPIIGRADVIRALVTRLPRQRFVTIAGPGGIGKTTVALAVAEGLAASYGDGATFVDLAPVADPLLVPSALSSALRLAIRAEDPVAGLVAALRERRMLILLDGCEHVVVAAAALAEALLKGAPGVAILATSREPLRAEGEWVQRLPPLGLPPASAALTAAEAMRFPAVQLFVERAAASLGGFALSDADAPVVAEICRRLDGIALAIELAAGCMDAFGLRELEALLDDRFRVLTRGRRTALPHHQTLRATLDWSCGILPASERLILRRLSVFNGGFTLAAAYEVAMGGEIARPEFGDHLACLVAKSLVATEVGDAEVPVYYRLLDTTRAYAREKLEESGESEELGRRHAEYHRRLFERAEAEWETRPTAAWLAAYARRIDDLRAALTWAFAPGGDASVGVALTAAAVPLWFQLSLVDEGLGWVERALASLEAEPGRDERRRMRLHAALGWLEMYAAAKLDSSAAAWSTALGLAEELGDADYQLRALWALWADRTNHGELREALALADRFRGLAAVGTADAADRLVGERMTGASLHFLGDQAGARERIERMLGRYVTPVHRAHTVRFQFDQRVTARITLARVLWLQGFADAALREVGDNVEHALSTSHTLSLCNALAQAACPVALLAGDLAAAERYAAMLRGRTAAHALDVWRAYADGFEGELLVRRGDPDAGLPLLRAAVDQLRRAGFVQCLTAFLAALALGVADAGRQVEEGLAAVEEGLARCERTGERWCLPELRRIKAEVLLKQGAPDAVRAAEALLLQSLRTAREQGALSWELRTATSLAGLWRAQGRGRDARDLLAPVYGRFVEGFAMTDLLRAAAVLKDLQRRPAGDRPATLQERR
jgi:predicted ATPase/DNA-binding winged helix-turn-helix (wHTH) protein